VFECLTIVVVVRMSEMQSAAGVADGDTDVILLATPVSSPLPAFLWDEYASDDDTGNVRERFVISLELSHNSSDHFFMLHSKPRK
jgi:hypothetical protein